MGNNIGETEGDIAVGAALMRDKTESIRICARAGTAVSTRTKIALRDNGPIMCGVYQYRKISEWDFGTTLNEAIGPISELSEGLTL